MKARISFALAVLSIAGFVEVAAAKPLSRIIAEMGLSPADFEVVNAVSTTLLSNGTPSVGQEQSWMNAETGSQGTVRVNGVQDNCVQLQHFIQPEGADDTREIRTQRCKDASGNWIMTP
ncbi:hypothetical protein HW561_15210 [Rhodobacteraceae bacterium B1Z28]|uniref:Outer membrane surface antigen n=1 Tax=Ruegeria haliotis TaxID=2747601 RepID=A0ABX2PUV0_9RHOB|nr:hypothetical protein [Ruegeria haliotis]NVO57141.1 hypothetical protein [Ruegeria haliotis]